VAVSGVLAGTAFEEIRAVNYMSIFRDEIFCAEIFCKIFALNFFAEFFRKDFRKVIAGRGSAAFSPWRIR